MRKVLSLKTSYFIGVSTLFPHLWHSSLGWHAYPRSPVFCFYVHYALYSNFIFALFSVESSCRSLICSAQKLPSSDSKLPLPIVTAVISGAAQPQREVSLVLSLCSQAIFPMLLFYYFILFVVPVILPGQRGKEI